MTTELETATMRDIEAEVAERFRATVQGAQSQTDAALISLKALADSPFAGNGLKAALTDAAGALLAVSDQLPTLYDVIRDRFGAPGGKPKAAE